MGRVERRRCSILSIVTFIALAVFAQSAAGGADKDCTDFDTQQEAQQWLLPGDPHNLDDDGDGIACELLASGASSAVKRCGTVKVQPGRVNSDVITDIATKGVSCRRAKRLIRQAARTWPENANVWTSGGFRWRAKVVEITAAMRGVSGSRWIRGTYVVF